MVDARAMIIISKLNLNAVNSVPITVRKTSVHYPEQRDHAEITKYIGIIIKRLSVAVSSTMEVAKEMGTGLKPKRNAPTLALSHLHLHLASIYAAFRVTWVVATLLKNDGTMILT